VLLADLDHVDGPRESRLIRVRRVATPDEHTPRGIEPALDVVVHVLAVGPTQPVLPAAVEAVRVGADTEYPSQWHVSSNQRSSEPMVYWFSTR
jgi:hypothetical protein